MSEAADILRKAKEHGMAPEAIEDHFAMLLHRGDLKAIIDFSRAVIGLYVPLAKMVEAYAEGHDNPNEEPTMVRDAILALHKADRAIALAEAGK